MTISGYDYDGDYVFKYVLKNLWTSENFRSYKYKALVWSYLEFAQLIKYKFNAVA